MKKLFLISSALVTFWSQGAMAGKDAEVFNALGWIYEVGHNGTPKNLHTAYSRYEKADKKGHPAAKQAMQRVIGQMTPEQQEGYDPSRPVPELPSEVWLHILSMVDGASLGHCASVSPQLKEVAEDDVLWSPFAKKYNVDKKEGIPLKQLVQVDYYMKKGLLARFEKNSKLEESFLNQAMDVGDGSAFFFSIPNDGYWEYLEEIKGCKPIIDNLAKHGNKEADLRRLVGLSGKLYGYNRHDALNALEERMDRYEEYRHKIKDIDKDEARIESRKKEWKPSVFYKAYHHALEERILPLSKLQAFVNMESKHHSN